MPATLKATERTNNARMVTDEIKSFVDKSPLNRMPDNEKLKMFDEPLVKFTDADENLFEQFKSIIHPEHLTPREALALAYHKKQEDLPRKLSIISWVLPITFQTRKSNREQKALPSTFWAYTRNHGEKFNEALRSHMVKFLKDKGYLASAPMAESFFKGLSNEKGPMSNWSERHIAYVAGQGTFSLSDGFITEKGIAHRCGNVVTDLALPRSKRTATGPYSNCLYYVNQSCKACIVRCPAGAITESGHNKFKCGEYMRQPEFIQMKTDLKLGITGCGLCQVKVPCEAVNPTKKLK